MLKGFIDYKNGKIPFVVEGYIMELFSDANLIRAFANEYKDEINFVLQGQCNSSQNISYKITFLVEKIEGDTCYLSCYLVYNTPYDMIGIQSCFIDSIFRYSYNFIDMAREGINLSYKSRVVYNIDFPMDEEKYNLIFRIGYNSEFGLLEDWNRKGELLIETKTGEIQESYNIIKILYRFCMFMQSQSDISFKKIVLYKKGISVGQLYCPIVMDGINPFTDILYKDFDVLKYAPKILGNIGLDYTNRIENSIPLGHLGNANSIFLPQRFLEQIISFEYLFYKINPKISKSDRIPLKQKLEDMFKNFSLYFKAGISFDEISKDIANLRNKITHGYFYYYDFKDYDEIKHLMILMDKLIKVMSLSIMGFTNDEIKNFPTLFDDLEYIN